MERAAELGKSRTNERGEVEGGVEEGYTAKRGAYPSRPSIAAAPPGIILVMKIPGSSGMWGLSIPPAMLKPRPEFP